VELLIRRRLGDACKTGLDLVELRPRSRVKDEEIDELLQRLISANAVAKAVAQHEMSERERERENERRVSQ